MWHLFYLTLVLLTSQSLSQDPVCKVAPPCQCRQTYVDGVYGPYIYCFRKRLTEVPRFAPGTSVLRVDLRENHISSIRMNAFINVSTWEIFLDENRIREINPGAFTGLETTLRSLTLQENENLQPLNDVFKNMTRLRKFDLSKTYIRKAPFVPYLTELDVSNNKINDNTVDGYFPTYYNLSKLNLGYNELETFPNSSLFQVKSSLVQLDLKQNRIGSIESGSLKGYSQLKTLDLSSNRRFKDIPTDALTDVPQLESLNMYYNDIHTISDQAFDNVPNLKTVHLGFNPIRNIPSAALRPLRKLESFTVWNISMVTIPENAFSTINSPNMGHINIGSNLLRSLPENLFGPVKTLHSLHINSNYLTNLPENLFESMNRLSSLRLENNQFEETPKTLRHLTRLSTLYMFKNQLREFSGDEIAENSELSSIDLNDNLISVFPTSLFTKAPKLNRLILSKNNISNIHSCVLTMAEPKLKLSNLYLDSNPLHCDCHMMFLRKHRPDIRLSSTGRDATCETPESLRGRSVTSLTESDYNCTTSYQELCPERRQNAANKEPTSFFTVTLMFLVTMAY